MSASRTITAISLPEYLSPTKNVRISPTHTHTLSSPVRDSPFRHLGQLAVILLRKLTRRGSDIELKHAFPRFHVGQGNVDPLFESNLPIGVSARARPAPTCEKAGRGTCRRLMAGSSCHGILVAPSTNTPVSSFPTPFIYRQPRLVVKPPIAQHTENTRHTCTKNSVFIRLLASDSPSLRDPASESTSSIKMIDGFASRAI